MKFSNLIKMAAVAAALTLGGSPLAGSESRSDWKAHWITPSLSQSATNTWISYRKEFKVSECPDRLVARISADSKYWMWINGELAVFEGGLKRGPFPNGTYYDKVDIAPFLKEGDNTIAILLWHFGKQAFSHNSSGQAALIFEAVSPGLEILSDQSWVCALNPAYGSTDAPHPNYRLPESNIRFDARKDMPGWNMPGFDVRGKMHGADNVDEMAWPAMGRMAERPIPMWKDYGLKEYVSVRQSNDTLYCKLPYNAQVTPYLKVEAKGGEMVRIMTDNYFGGSANNVRAEYITRDGVQEYESLGWMNGHEVWYIVPSGVKVVDLKYRETGYDTEFSGTFECGDPFLNELWKRSARTLYITMRDTYMDCPDRERAQWWGDEVNELGMAFYSLSPSSWALAVKGIHELVNWQRVDGVLSSPVPAFNYSAELPSQMLAALGWYGFHAQYFYSGDDSFVPVVYDRMKKYLHEVWRLDENGIPVYRTGDWDWPDADSPVDQLALMPCLYYLALKGELEFARLLGKTGDVAMISSVMERLKDSYNRLYWTGEGYRSPSYRDRTDDRPQAMAVLAGIASEDKYPAIARVLKTTDMASTYMEKYMVEALFVLGEPSAALDRMKRRMATIMDERSSTLYEHWHWTNSSNHAWSGANIILLGQKVCGVAPLTPAFETFSVRPQMGWLRRASTSFETKYGRISVSLSRKTTKSRSAVLEIDVPAGTKAEVVLKNSRTAILESGHHKVEVKI